jgi:hypothetical protein
MSCRDEGAFAFHAVIRRLGAAGGTSARRQPRLIFESNNAAARRSRRGTGRGPGPPHYYRRADLPEVLIATSPLSDRDAAKRVIGADKPLKEAGIPTLTGLTEVATQLRQVVTRRWPRARFPPGLPNALMRPTSLLRIMPATHSWKSFPRSALLYAGLELEPGTSPPAADRSRVGRNAAHRACPGRNGCSSVPATDPHLPPVSRTRHTKTWPPS